ncbi:MAG: hypothetical protein KJ732_05545 [Candidatus Margulisbacteria bacterium]|nr:hypothetical protein [Candidatus Margulisiibacteriota bacterium]
MAGSSKRKNGQKRVLEEIRKQLVLQAERWGKTEYYTAQRLEEMVLEQCFKIKGDFLSEKANLEYEMQSIESDKKECLIKLEKLTGYLKKSDRSLKIHKKAIGRWLERLIGDRQKTQWALDRKIKKPVISVLIGEN